MSPTLENHVVLVTGGARNLGRCVAERAASGGAAVAVNFHRDLAAASEVVTSIEEAGGRALAVRADVTEPAEVEAMVEEAATTLGPITSVIHCAAYRSRHRPITETSFDDWSRVIEVALDGAFLCATATLPGMVDRRFGRLVFVGGSASYTGRPDGSTAGASAKAGLDGLARSIAQEFGQQGVTANVVAPGALDTERTRRLEATSHWSPIHTSTIRRPIRLEEVAAMCTHLLSDLGGAINGARLLVDGGLMAR